MKETHVSEQNAQNYQNHRSFDKIFLGFALLTVAVVLAAGVDLVRHPGLSTAVVLTLAISLLVNYAKTRNYAVTVQDRVVRLEMQLRLERLLSGDLKDQAQQLSLAQLVGLRYASDEELPELTQKVLTDKIANRDDIKKLVKVWRADHLRV